MDAETQESLRLWDGIAAGWEKYRDDINQQERPITDRMIDALGVEDGDTILELCAGSGGVGLQVAERFPNASILVTDFGPHMVEAAARGAKERGLSNVETRVVDAQAIELPDASVDGVISRYGLMIPPDQTKVFSEIRRVLKPGRRLSYATWGPIQTNAWMMLVGAPLMQRGLFTPDPRGFPLADEDANRGALQAAGFTDVAVEELDYPMAFETFDRYWDVQTSVAGLVADIVRQLPEDQRREIHDEVEGFSASFKTDAGYAFPARRVLVRAS